MGRVIAGLALVGLLTVGVGAGSARPAGTSDTVTIGFLITNSSRAGWDAMAQNFQRAYPNIRVDINYQLNNDALNQIETTELAAGNAPELLGTTPGCGTVIAICKLAKAGYLAPMVSKPWASHTRSLSLITSYTKFRKKLYGFAPQVAPLGIFTNDTLFTQLGLKIPQTYAQLLDVCKKAKAAGTAPMIIAGGSATAVTFLLEGLAVPLVYGKDSRWTARLKAGKVTFRGSSGWRQAMQRFIDMNDAGCFEPGATGVSSGPAASTFFAQGRGLMLLQTSNAEGGIAAGRPAFSYSFHALPSGRSPSETTTFVSLSQAVSVNAHASARNRAAAQTFVDFLARPAQNALFTQLTGGLSAYQIRKRQVPGFMASMGPVFAKQRYITNPYASWWNPGVLGAMQDNQIGLITGQRSIDDVLKAMDVAWKKGPG